MNIFIDPFEHVFWYNIAIYAKCVNHLSQKFVRIRYNKGPGL